ncbi:MAG: hypothetical protein ACT4QE_05040 [Anaerolineales bacterium]
MACARVALIGGWLALSAGAFHLTPDAVQAQTATWSGPMQISPEGQFAWFPDIAVDLAGQLHVVYSSGTIGPNRTAFDSVMYVTSPTGDVWTDPNDIFSIPQPGPGESAATRPVLLVDARNDLHIGFTDYFRIFYSHVYATEAANARAWSPVQFLGTSNTAYFSGLTIDSQDRLNFVYTENLYSTQCPICFHLYHRYSDDFGRTWSPAVDISGSLQGSAKPQLVADAQDNLHLVWDSGVGGSLGQLLSQSTGRYSASYNRGETWSPPIAFISPLTDTAVPRETQHTTVGVDGRDQVVVVWLGLPDDRVYFQVSDDQGRTWSSPEIIAELWGGQAAFAIPTDTYAMIGDSAGNLHLALAGRRAAEQQRVDLLHVVWDGERWSAPELIAPYQDDVPEWPRLAVKNGNELHAVWFTRNVDAVFGSDTGGARYRVWYANTTLDSPARPPVSIPTRVATVAPTPTLESAGPVVGTPTPLPTYVFGTPGPSLEQYRENDYLTIAAVSLLPVAALIAGVVAFRRLRQR